MTVGRNGNMPEQGRLDNHSILDISSQLLSAVMLMPTTGKVLSILVLVHMTTKENVSQ